MGSVPVIAASLLVVEDDPDTRGGMRDLLEHTGFLVTTAADGREALEHLRGRPTRVSLIVLDWLMPVMAGPEFLARLAIDPVHAGTPVLVLSAYDRAIATGLGVTAMVPKPVRNRTLIEVIHRLAGMPRAPAPAAPEPAPPLSASPTVMLRPRRH